jgi:PAS domain S-box-containing protein
MDILRKFKGIQANLKRYKVPLIIILAGMLLVAVLYQEGRKSALENLNKQFAVDAATRAGIIINALTAHLIDLDALHRFYSASTQVERRQFTEFVAPTLKNRPGVQAFEWIPRVPQSERPRFEAEARRDGMQGYYFYQLDSKGNHVPVAPHEYYYPVYFVDPLAGNERAVGFDLGANPARLAALEKARDTGQPTVTGRITLVQETSAQAGFLIFIPVYRQETPIATEEQRRLALQGFALGVFRAGDTIETAIQPLPEKGLLTELVDLSPPADESLLYRNDKEPRNLPVALWKKWLAPAVTLHYTHPFTFAGRHWQLNIVAATSYVQGHISLFYWLIPPFGIGLTLSLALYLGALIFHREHAENLVAELSALNEGLHREVDERQRAEESLRQANEILRATLDAAPVAIFDMDTEGRVKSLWNPAAEQMLGWRRDEVLGHFVPAVPEEKMKESAVFRAWLHSGKPIMGKDVVRRRKDGSRIEYSIYAAPEYDEHGKVVGNMAVLVDLTERKEGERSLREQFRFLQHLIDTIPSLIFYIDVNGVYLGCNQSMANFFGRPKEEIIGKTVFDLYPQKQAEKYFQMDQDLFQHPGTQIYEFMMTRSDGAFRNFIFSKSTFIDSSGKVTGLIGVMTDITARKQAERSLTEQFRFLQHLIDTIPSPIFYKDENGVYLECNQSMANFLGRPKEEIIGKTVFDIYPPEHAEKYFKMDQDLFQHPGTQVYEFMVEGADGTNRNFIFSKATFLDSSGKVAGLIGAMTDITARKQAERSLTEQFRFLQNLIDTIPTPIFYKDVNGVYLGCNQSMADFLGRPKEEIIGKTVFDIYPLEHAEKYFQMDQELFQHPGTQVYEFLMEGADGTNRNFIFSKATFVDSSGKVAGLIGAMTDITDRKRAEKEIQRLASFPQLNPNPILEVDMEGRITFYNQAALKALGETGTAADLGNFLPGYLQEILSKVKETGELHFQQEVVVNGAVFLLIISSVKQLNVVRLYGIDITERKRAEEELGESLRRNQLILDSLPSAALLIRADRTIVVSNQAAARVGAVPDQPCYATLWGLDAACPWCKAQEVLQTGKSQQAEIEAAGKVWEAHWIPIDSNLVFHFIYDITELKEAEQERAKLREQLFQAQKMEAIGTLAGGIAHDFNNILSAIIGYGEMLDLFHSAECPQVKPDLKEILKAAFRAKDLVQQILTFSRKTKQDRMSLDILPVIKESLKFLRASLPSTIEIIQSLDPKLGPVFADPTQMQQVVMNLCTNAAHAMRDRGGVLEVRLTEVVIGEENGEKVLKLAPGLYARLTVKDSGRGIPPEILPKIFDPYFTTKEMGEGTGLGLAIVEGIVQGHGGAITVESDPDVGTVFQVFIPILERHEIDLPPITTTQIPRGQGRILLVDDEPALTNMGQEILINLGYEVEALSSSATALEHFRQHPQRYDLAILDFTMPQMTGLELAREIRQLRPDFPIILTSGFAEQLSQDKLTEAGIRELLKKPFLVETLAATINQVLG